MHVDETRHAHDLMLQDAVSRALMRRCLYISLSAKLPYCCKRKAKLTACSAPYTYMEQWPLQGMTPEEINEYTEKNGVPLQYQ